MNYDTFLRLAGALNEEEVEYILVGGVAMGLHGIVRATEDVDLFIRPDFDNVERLKRALRRVWDDPAIDDIRAEEMEGAYPTIRYGPPDGDLYIDIITRLGDAWSFDTLEFEVITLQGVPIRVATTRTLYVMKRDTLRSLDKADAAMLKEYFNVKEEE